MADLVLWCGPVYANTLSKVAWPDGTNIVVESQGINGIGSDAFSRLGASFGANPLQAIASKHGVDWGSIDRIAVVGFSAGHGLIGRILSSADGPRVNVLGSMDAYFTGFDFAVKPGYLAMAERAAQGDGLALFTTSDWGSNNPPYPASTPAVQKLLAEFSLSDRAPPASVPAPSSCVGTGNLWWAHYENALGTSHEDHANKLAAPWSSALLAPALAGASAAPDGTPIETDGDEASDGLSFLQIIALALVGVGGALLVKRALS